MNTSPIRTPKPSASRTFPISVFILVLASFWVVLMVSNQRTEAQSSRLQVQMDLLSVHESTRQFYETQAENQRYRDRERLNVPSYSSDLSKVVAAFQEHISDMHFRHVTCKTCKDQVKRIRQLAKDIEGAMK